jgi:hypothetical protein
MPIPFILFRKTGRLKDISCPYLELLSLLLLIISNFRIMYSSLRKYILAFSPIIFIATCKKIYEPAAIKANNNYLVVDGIINIGSNSITTINLNRSLNLGDTATEGIPELNAQVFIESSAGANYSLIDSANNGIYTSAALNLDINQKYSIAITTSNGHKYSSDFVECKQTPPIDSLYWQQPADFTVYLNSHDPNNKTLYYRWDYTETWEHDAQLQTVWGVKNGLIFPADSTTQKSNCWTTANSTNILLGASANLSKDVISHAPITTIINGDAKLYDKYSILVRQYALTMDAYNYWLLIQETSQSLGTLFDLQPSQLNGNIHSSTDPNEPVIGFVSASSIQQKRIFIYYTNLSNWQDNPIIYTCDTLQIPVNQTDYRIYNYPDTLYAPWYFITNGPLVLASKICLDCTLFGGTNVKPSYWQ